MAKKEKNNPTICEYLNVDELHNFFTTRDDFFDLFLRMGNTTGRRGWKFIGCEFISEEPAILKVLFAKEQENNAKKSKEKDSKKREKSKFLSSPN